ncbi:LPXTG cell wall anchor domain-containing protein [Levilactobacillus yiduensis]|uniref:LPXTG cell wall anchor domain-containing protein n=1 Tax=Levilactobacillus yiduensis TaxID=2953880 RepID=UPI0021580D9F|nr:LPXTG cell wall anchor domain-containing protein [Levilactobacillus yiduensis]
MKKLIMWFVLTLTLTIGVGMGTPALAKTVVGTSGTTQTSVYIIGNPEAQTRTSGAAADLPAGPIKKKSAGDTQTAGDNNGKKKSTPANLATVVKAGSADLIAGRLPQTSESRMFLMSVFGLLLLIVAILSMIVYHQARLLKGRE